MKGDTQMKLRVMVAEDERLAREELVYLLSKEPDIVVLPSAASGAEALEIAQKHKPDAVFLDIEMPEMNGIQALIVCMSWIPGRLLSSRRLMISMRWKRFNSRRWIICSSPMMKSGLGGRWIASARERRKPEAVRKP